MWLEIGFFKQVGFDGGQIILFAWFQVGSRAWQSFPLSKESGLGFQVLKVGGRKLFPLSSVEGLQTGTP